MLDWTDEEAVVYLKIIGEEAFEGETCVAVFPQTKTIAKINVHLFWSRYQGQYKDLDEKDDWVIDHMTEVTEEEFEKAKSEVMKALGI